MKTTARMTIKKSKVAIFSDIHLGLYANSTDWHKIAMYWANWIVADLKKNNIKDVLFLGDFFHNRSEISVQTVHVASEILDLFKDFNMLMIVGNHDAFYKNRSDVHSLALLKGHTNVTVIDELLEFEAFGKTFAMAPWNCDVSEVAVDYLFGHFEIQSFKMNNFKVCDHGLSPVDLIAKNGMVFSGHFHKRHFQKYSQGVIHYVGNTFHHDFNDVGNDRGYHILDVETGELEFVRNTVSPEFKKVYLSKIRSYTEDDIKKNIVKFVIDKDIPLDKIENVKTYLNKFKPYQIHSEYDIKSSGESIDDDNIEAFELEDMLMEYSLLLKLEDDKQKRVEGYLKDLYEKNKG